jgi:hypothetical protein
VVAGAFGIQDVEDKDQWCERSLSFEQHFVKVIAPMIGLDAEINPEKTSNPYAPDLLVEGRVADLKFRSTPFFTAEHPQWAVTLNCNDVDRYLKEWPDIRLFFWVYWEACEAYGTQVGELGGVWEAHLGDVAGCRRHVYQRRVGDQRNARDSFILDLRDLRELSNVIDR